MLWLNKAPVKIFILDFIFAKILGKGDLSKKKTNKNNNEAYKFHWNLLEDLIQDSLD